MVYLTMFGTIIDQILRFWVLIRWKRVIIFQSLIPSGTLDFFAISEDPPPDFELFPTKTWDFGLIPKFRSFFDWKASLMLYQVSTSYYVWDWLQSLLVV